MLAWGIVMVCMGIVQSYGGLLAARFFLGIAEVSCKKLDDGRFDADYEIQAGFFPGATFLYVFLTIRVDFAANGSCRLG